VETGVREAGLLRQRFGAIPHGVPLVGRHRCDLLEAPQPGAQLHVHDAAVRGHHHQDRDRQVRRDPADARALARRLPDQADVSLLEVAHAAVDQLRAAAGGAGREVDRLDQGHGEAA
jgi:hypothetical protein